MKPRIRPRLGYLVMLALSWIVLVVLMWQAFRTMPSAESLRDARHVPPPLPGDFVRYVVESLAQLILVTAMLWPWWRRHYIWPGLAVTLALMAWFILSVPLQ
ncbi:MAG TPA: hypothetical protein VF021_02455, partial [Longimicrobiales bacterium]